VGPDVIARQPNDVFQPGLVTSGCPWRVRRWVKEVSPHRHGDKGDDEGWLDWACRRVGCVGGVGAEQGYVPCLSRRQRALGVVCKDDEFAVWRPGTTILDGDGRFPIERLRGDERGRKINGAGRQCQPKVPQFEKHLNSRSFPIHQQTTSSNRKWLTPQLQALHRSEIASISKC